MPEKLPPTPRRLSRALEEGDTSHSAGLTGAVATAAAVIVAVTLAPSLAGAFMRSREDALSPEFVASPSLEQVRASSASLGSALVDEALPLALIFVAVVSLAGLVQTRFNVATRRPIARALSAPAQQLRQRVGLRRVAPMMLRACACVALTGATIALIVRDRGLLLSAIGGDVGVWIAGGEWMLGLVATLGAWGLLVGVVDALLSRALRARSMRMTRDEVRRDQRAVDGSPEARQQRRAQAQSAAKSRAVTLDQVVLALWAPAQRQIALIGYAPGELDPPHLGRVAFGAQCDDVYSEALAAGVPIINAPVMTRQVIARADVGHPIPERFFDALIALLHEHPQRLPSA